MTRNQQGFIYAVCFILFGLIMGALWLLLTGISEDFGMGVAAGAFIGVGIFALASRTVREAP